MKKVAILTTFNSYSEAYSLNRVVSNQIRMFVDNGYKPVVVVGEGFKPVKDYADPNVEIREIPNVSVYNEVKMDSTFEQDVLALEKKIANALEDIDVVITHDIIYQPACVKHLVACKRIAKRRPDILWLHWIHSATSPYTLQNLRPLFVDEYAKIISEKFPNSFYIFFNHYSIPRIAQNFNINDLDVKIVPHPTDMKDFYKMDAQTWEFIREKNLLFADVVCVYPIRLDRGKQIEKVIKTIASFKKLLKSVRLVIADFHSTGGDKVKYREECKEIARKWNLTEEELIWLSEERSSWNVEVPYGVISGLFRISNVFIGTSSSESYSLITQEAGLSGVTMVLNRDFPPTRDIFGWAPHYAPFSSNINATTGLDGDTTTKIENEEQFYLDVARVLNYELENDRSLVLKTALRKQRNLDFVFKKFLEPILYYEKK